MGFFSKISNWQTEKYEKYKGEMQLLGNCPDCSGCGFIPSAPALSALYIPPYECPGCNGSGLYSDWFEANQ